MTRWIGIFQQGADLRVVPTDSHEDLVGARWIYQKIDSLKISEAPGMKRERDDE